MIFLYKKNADSLLAGSNFLIVLSILLAVVCLVVLCCGMGYGMLKCAVLWRAGVHRLYRVLWLWCF